MQQSLLLTNHCSYANIRNGAFALFLRKLRLTTERFSHDESRRHQRADDPDPHRHRRCPPPGGQTEAQMARTLGSQTAGYPNRRLGRKHLANSCHRGGYHRHRHLQHLGTAEPGVKHEGKPRYRYGRGAFPFL